MNIELIKNKRWKIKTPSGWSNFDGIKRSHRKTLSIKFDDNSFVRVTPEHLLKNYKNKFVEARSLKKGSLTSTGLAVVGIDKNSDLIDVYDVINVKSNHEYNTNNVISHNCAFIRNFEDIWTGLSPTISTGGRALILSTPNGVGGMYYKLWVDAEAGQNGFNPIKLPWDVHPEHDHDWFIKETRNLPRRKVAQEYVCDFQASGDTFLQSEDLEWLKECVKQPIEKQGHDRNVWIWKHPEPKKRYVISGDIARGDAADFSAFHIIDADNCEIVVEYMGKCPPEVMGSLMNEFGRMYNNALAIPERNSFGYTTCIWLRDNGYPCLYYDKHKGDPFKYIPPDRKQLPGFDTQKKSRINILTRLEEMVRNKKLMSYSARMAQQMQAFVWNGTKPQALKDSHDDLIISAAIGTWIVGGTFHYDAVGHARQVAILSATTRESRDKSVSPLSHIDMVKPVPNNSMQQVNPMSVSKPQDPATIKHVAINDFSWLLK